LKKPLSIALYSLFVMVSLLVPILSWTEFGNGNSVVPPTDLRRRNTTGAPICATDLAKAVYEAVSLSSYRQFIVKLTENGSRYYGSTANNNAISWLARELVDLSGGKVNVSILGTYRSVVGRLPGHLGTGGPSIIIGGHFDSVPAAPGANDDGTGVAAVLELTRVLSEYDWPLNIYFCLWNNEEQGLYGSREVSGMFLASKVDVLVNFNVDMLLVQDPNSPPDQRVLMNYQEDSGTIYQDARYWAELTRCMNNNFAAPIIWPSPSSSFQFWRQSDHYSFVQRGYRRNIFAFESGQAYDNAYHSSRDTWNNSLYNYTVAATTVASIGASIAFTLSRTLGQLTYSRYTTVLSPSATREYLFDMTMPTQVEVRASWSGGGGLQFTALDPNSSQLTSNSTTASAATNTTVLRVNTTELGMHSLRITNTGDNPITTDIELVYETDLEGDGVPDRQEFWQNAFLIDSDGDGVSNGDEMIRSLNRFNPDTDGDGLNDGDELRLHTDPRYYDSDFDGMPDGWEVEYGLNPLVDDSEADPDKDELANSAEYNHGTNPKSNDTEADGIPDGWEVAHGLNPLVDDSQSDPDEDGVINLVEYRHGTNPQSNDTDGDHMPDGWEIAHALNPLVDDSKKDPDGDGLTNIVEYQTGQDPHVFDSGQSLSLQVILFAGTAFVCAVAFLIVVKITSHHPV